MAFSKGSEFARKTCRDESVRRLPRVHVKPAECRKGSCEGCTVAHRCCRTHESRLRLMVVASVNDGRSASQCDGLEVTKSQKFGHKLVNGFR